MSEIKDCERIDITEEEYRDIVYALDFYNNIGDAIFPSPPYKNPYTQVCVVYEDIENGIIRLTLLHYDEIFREKEFRKIPFSRNNIVDEVKAFLYEGLNTVYITI